MSHNGLDDPQYTSHHKSKEYSDLESKWLLDVYYWEAFKIYQGTSLATGSTITIDPDDYEVVGEYRDKILYERKYLASLTRPKEHTII